MHTWRGALLVAVLAAITAAAYRYGPTLPPPERNAPHHSVR
jgi:hypothetical protein